MNIISSFTMTEWFCVQSYLFPKTLLLDYYNVEEEVQLKINSLEGKEEEVLKKIAEIIED